MNADKIITGLSSEEARQRLTVHGPNLIVEPERISFFGIARHEVTEPMILLLLVVGILYSMWGNPMDSATIFIVIILLVLAEVHNEYRAKKAIASLEKIAAPKTRVLRDGTIVEIGTEGVVPGDVVVLAVGTSIPADARIIGAITLQIDESALTGESFPQDRDKGDEIYAGTVVVSGEGEAEVIATGKQTRLGAIASTLRQVKRPRTPLQIAMKSLVKKLVFVAVFFSAVIPVIGIIQGRDIKTMVLTGLSLSFATIPEELPIIITMVLGLGAYTLSTHNFFVKRLRAAETLGNASVIVTDKTGTITEGKMNIVSFYPGERSAEILEKALGSVSEYALSPIEREIERKAAELNAGRNISRAVRQRGLGSDGRKTRAVVRPKGNDYEIYLIGAPEEVFMSCRGVSDDVKAELDRAAAKGRRVVAVAFGDLPSGAETSAFAEIERNLELAGLIVFEDSPRKGVKETIAVAAKAGIRTIMVTGDHALTARSIAADIGISGERILKGSDLDVFTDEELKARVKDTQVFARTTPIHKYRIVKALQEGGEVVAVTGDGINDVLALKAADIGIAMGKRGTDVAKDAAEVVLADDNYITITQGIFEGRKFFDNLRKGIKYYLSVKAALVMIFLLPVLLGVPLPFSPIQIVVLELFMDLAASAGFVSEPAEKEIFSRPPRKRTEEVLSRSVIRDIFVNGSALFAAVIIAYFYGLSLGLGVAQVQTFAFSAWIFGHVILACISRADREYVFSLGILTNRIIALWAVSAVLFLVVAIYVPFLGGRFNLAQIGPGQLALIAAVTSAVVGTLELKKRFVRNPAA